MQIEQEPGISSSWAAETYGLCIRYTYSPTAGNSCHCQIVVLTYGQTNSLKSQSPTLK